jgi:hypothetical protein
MQFNMACAPVLSDLPKPTRERMRVGRVGKIQPQVSQRSIEIGAASLNRSVAAHAMARLRHHTKRFATADF